MQLRELLVKIGFDTSEGKEKIDKVGQALDGLKEKLELFAAFEITKKLYELSESFAHWGEELEVTAGNIGLSVEEMQKLQFAAQQSGVSAELMSHSLALLSRKIYEAKTGSLEAAEAFRKAGISTEQIHSFKSAEDALGALADNIKNIQDPMKRMAVAQELAGRGGYQMVSFLSKGSAAMREQGNELKKLGLVLSGPQVEAIANLEHAFQRLHAMMHAFGAQIVSQIGPVFGFLIDKFIAFYGANKDLIAVNIQHWLIGLSYMLGFVAGFFIGITKRVIEFAKSFHIENDILKFVFMLFGALSAIFALGTGFKIFMAVFNIFKAGFTPLIALLKLLGSGLMSIFGIVKEGFAVIQATSAVFLEWALPILGIVAAIAALIVVGHDLYALFEGKPTWIGQFWDWLEALRPVKIAIEAIKTAWEYTKNGFSSLKLDAFELWEDSINGAKNALKGFFAFVENFKKVGAAGFDWIEDIGKRFLTWAENLHPVQAILQSLSSLGGVSDLLSGVSDFFGGGDNANAKGEQLDTLGTGGSALLSPSNSSSATSNSNVNQNNTFNINVPPGTNPHDVTDHVKKQMKEHLDYTARSTARSFQGGPVR